MGCRESSPARMLGRLSKRSGRWVMFALRLMLADGAGNDSQTDFPGAAG